LHQPEPSTTDVFLGRRLGSYQLVERIGQGGMGAIYRARRIGSGEEAAIKVIKRGMDTDAILRRFETEHRILAALDHPNIARLLDAGATPDGMPYFVMEFIAGRPIHRFCDSERLSLEARLRLFQKVCSAVAYAHGMQVIHRDIKPENILVTADGEPKLLDFGIAKVLASEYGDVSQERTITLAPAMTPHYASPEQARGGPLTPSTDIYSLGVLLYELLAGVSPYRQVEHSRQALVDAICRRQPTLPSWTIGHATADPRLLAILTARGASREELRDALKGNLDAIVATSLEKEPSQRYGSVEEFSADIGLHLAGARARSRRYIPRSLRRPKTWAAFAMLLVLAGAAAGIYRWRPGSHVAVRPSVAVLGFENLSHQQSTEWLSTALTEMLSTELAAGGRLRTVPGELVSRVKLELALPNAQTFTQATLGRLRGSLGTDYVVLGSYLALGDQGGLQVRLDLRLQDARSGETLAAVSETRPANELLPLVSRAGSQLRRQLGAVEPSPGPEASRAAVPEGAEAARNYAEGLERLRAFDTLTARDLLRNAVTAAPGHALSHAALAAASGLLGYDLEARDEARKALDLSAGLPRADRLSIEGRYFETTHAWGKAIETYQALRREYPDNVEYGLLLAAAETRSGAGRRAIETVQSLRALASAEHDPRLDLAESEGALAASDLPRARSAARRAAEAGSAAGLRILSAQARLLESRALLQSGEPQQALSAAAQSQQLYMAAGHRPGIARALIETAGVFTQLGDIAGARARYEEALAVCRAIGDQTCISTDLDSIGVLRRRQGDLKGALERHREALDIRRKVGDQAGVATSLYNIGNVLEVVGDLPGARQAAAEALEIRRQSGERRSTALTMSRLANVRRRLGELAESRRMNQEAVASLRAIGDRGGTAMALLNLGLTDFDSGDLTSSRSNFEEALAIRRQQRDRNNTAQALAALAAVALAQDRLAEARTLVAESISLRQQLGETITLAQSKLVLAEALREQGRAAEAENTAREAAAAFRAAQAPALEAEALLTVAAAQLDRDIGARAPLDAAATLLRESRDARLSIRREILLARVHLANGRQSDAFTILERSVEQARGLGLVGVEMEARLAMAQGGRAAALGAEARKAGFLLIGRKAGE
jgi:serine/threonine protein kinase/tetratricopeptide (TPR) repeat protein